MYSTAKPRINVFQYLADNDICFLSFSAYFFFISPDLAVQNAFFVILGLILLIF